MPRGRPPGSTNDFKKCLTCKVTKPKAEFLLDSEFPPEAHRTPARLFCRSCGRPPTKMKAFRLSGGVCNSRREFLNAKKAVPCAECGKKFPPVAMDFDHVRGTKKFNLSESAPMAGLLDELAKCEVVCSNCHRVREANRDGRNKSDFEPLPYGPIDDYCG